MIKGSLKNIFATPEPYFVPGYTGHCPSYNSTVGQTYGNATRTVMISRTSPPGRLNSLPSDPHEDNIQKEDLEIIKKRRAEKDNLLSRNIALGYTGHIPLASYQIGLNFTKSCIKGVVEFEKMKNAYEEFLKESGITREELPEHEFNM